MKTEKFEFIGHDGSTLAARLELPMGKPQATAIFAHCFTCSKDIPAARRISQHLAAQGIAVLRFDFTGLGHSGGEFANTHFSSNVEDLVLAAAALGEKIEAPSLLVGHSLGGAAVIKAACDLPSVKAVTTIGAPHDPGHVIHNFGATLKEIQVTGAAEVFLAGRPFTIKKSFIEDVQANSLDDCLERLKRALLVLHSPIDGTVGIENAAAIFSAAKHPKSFVTLDKADHLVTRPEDAAYVAEVIGSWAKRYLDLKPALHAKPEDSVVRSTELDADGFLQLIQSDVIATYADEPKSFGGSDVGLTPFEFLSAGLAACTAMTIRMYARHKKIPLDHVEVDVIHDKIHAAECEACETNEGKVDQFERRITLVGDFDAATRKRLLEIADRCPVHKTLHAEVSVKTELIEA